MGLRSLSELQARYRADVVFLLDKSQSMRPVLESLKEHIDRFVYGVKQQLSLSTTDLRIGFLAYDNRKFWQLDFTRDPQKFSTALAQIPAGGNELTLVALDYALSHFSWMDSRRWIVVLLTDEIVQRNAHPKKQLAKVDALREKIRLGPHWIYARAPRKCRVFHDLATLKNFVFVPLHTRNEYQEQRFHKVLDHITQTVSNSLKVLQSARRSVVKSTVYSLQDFGVEVVRL